MAHQRTYVVLPKALLAEIDALVGSRRRSAFYAEVAAREVRSRRLLGILRGDAPLWKPADHRNIDRAGGAAAWVRRVRREADRASKRRARPSRG